MTNFESFNLTVVFKFVRYYRVYNYYLNRGALEQLICTCKILSRGPTLVLSWELMSWQEVTQIPVGAFNKRKDGC